ncbi:hypothetical protein REPUB_Repub14bG0087200 [Reevesia pubescens]
MSRICVKNLPKHLAEDRLREFFSQKGEITDAKLMRTKDGKSRQFAFIGYRTEQEAEEAIKYFNKSYLDTSRVICEIARKVGDTNTPRPWSRYSSKKQDDVTETGKNTAGASKGGKKVLENSENDDPQLQEFLQVMQPRVRSKMWANDIVLDTPANQSSKVTEKKAVVEKEGRHTSASVDIDTDETNIALDNDETKASDNLSRDEVISDMDYFKSRVKKDWSDSDSDDNEENEDGDQKEENNALSENLIEDHIQEGSSKDLDGEILDPGNPSSGLKDDEVLESGRLFVRNLPYAATEDELTELFSKFGDVSQVHLVIDKDTKRSKGIAYILYKGPECAVRALEEVDKSIFQGRLLHVMPAKLKKPTGKQVTDDSANQGSKTFKQKREEERKASEASGDTRAWNSLFMRPDTVVENIARKYGVSKSELLDREADDLAVRIALGETQVIAETKKVLANAGVNISSLEEVAAGKTDGLKRSNHVLLVKNLPYGSSDGELAKMFGKFGSLDKVVFLEPAEARAAFKGLAYKRYKDAPLYLEWAPDNVLNKGSASEGDKKNNAAVGEHDVKRAILEQHVEGISDADIDPDRIESRSLFVKNLNFKTSEESLRNHFTELVKQGRIQCIRIKKHLKNGKQVSMGYGFIEFDSVETATNVCRDLQGTILDGHALILQLCHAKKEQPVKSVEKDKSSTKLLVRNVAFEATEKDLRQLFRPFGQIKSLRLPMKFGNHRGFGFVEFVTKQEAQNALQALSSTHLYGRHLVLERAKEGESLEELRARTAAQFTDEQNAFQNPTRLSKKRKKMEILDYGRKKFEKIAD